jgi:hypothetical protein
MSPARSSFISLREAPDALSPGTLSVHGHHDRCDNDHVDGEPFSRNKEEAEGRGTFEKRVAPSA